MTVTRKASLSLQFVVIGGSIAGLACAYALRQAGHEVRVLEKNAGLSKGNGRISSPPNMTRILNEWGLGPLLDEKAFKRSATAFNLCATGEQLGKLVFQESIMKALGAYFLNMTYDDIYTIMYDLAVEAGANIRFGAEAVEIDAERASVVLSTGEVCSGDVLIGADGLDSVVRRSVFEEKQSASDIPLFTAYALVDADVLEQDEDFRSLGIIEDPELTLWMGDGHSVWGCYSEDHAKYAVALAWTEHKYEYGDGLRSGHRCTMDELGLDVHSVDPRILKLCRMGDGYCPSPWVNHEPLESLVHESGKVLLVGAAAHPIPPNMEHTAAVGIEDAAALGNLFSRLRSRDQISSLTSAYDELRQPRGSDVFLTQRSEMELLLMKHGEVQAQRDDHMRAMFTQTSSSNWDNTDEEVLRQAWGEHIRMFDYDAREAVEDWWIKWGSLMNSSGGETINGDSSLEVRVSLLPGRRTS